MSADKKTPHMLNVHAKQRAGERYGLNLNKDARRNIVLMIQTSRAEFIGKESNTRSLWRVQYQNHSLNVVYDKARSTLCTVLPKEAAEFQEGVDWSEQESAKTAQTRLQITAELSNLWKDIE